MCIVCQWVSDIMGVKFDEFNMVSTGGYECSLRHLTEQSRIYSRGKRRYTECSSKKKKKDRLQRDWPQAPLNGGLESCKQNVTIKRLPPLLLSRDGLENIQIHQFY